MWSKNAKICVLILIGIAAYGCGSVDLGQKETPVGYPLIKYFQPGEVTHLWSDSVRQPDHHETTDQSIYTVGFGDVYRHVTAIFFDSQFIWEFNIAEPATLEFAMMSEADAQSVYPDSIQVQVIIESAEGKIQKEYDCPVTISDQIHWEDVQIALNDVTGPANCRISFTCSENQETAQQVSLFIGTPMVVPQFTEKKPHVVLWAFDSLRSDELGAYGSPEANTPTLDALSREGLLFSQSRSTSCWTLPGVQNMLAGRILHRDFNECHAFKHKQTEPIPLIQSEYSKAGYMTIGITSNHLLSPKHGLNVGFDIFDMTASHEWVNGSSLLLYQTVEKLLNRYSDRPLFIYIHAMDPHDPYRPFQPFDKICHAPDDSEVRERIRQRDSGHLNQSLFKESLGSLTDTEERYIRSYYRGEIRQMDSFFFAFLSMLKTYDMFDNTVISVAADHGEEFGEHGYYQHGYTLNEHVVNVPWIMFSPLKPSLKGIRDHKVSTMDIPATLLSYSGFDGIDKFEGINVLDDSQNIPEDRYIYTVVRSNNDRENDRCMMRAIYHGSRKLLWSFDDGIFGYDLAADPGQNELWNYDSWNSFTDAQPDLHWMEIGQYLQQFIADTEPGEPKSLPLEMKQKLRELGYIE